MSKYNDAPARQLTPGQILFILPLTVAYLIVELAFNARLLDVAGGLNADDVHALENFGRGLSGVAAALFVLQHLLRKCAGKLLIIVACAMSGVITFMALKQIADWVPTLLGDQDRKAASTLLYVREAMLSGGVVVDGLSDDANLFQQPAGKVFAAVFVGLGVLGDRTMEAHIAEVKHEIVKQAISKRLVDDGGMAKAYQQVREDMEKLYRGNPSQKLLQKISEQEQQRAWDDYTSVLSRNRLNPYNIPQHLKKRVWNEVQSKIPSIPRDWDLQDRQVFDRAVSNKVAKMLQEHPRSVFSNGTIIAESLTWDLFFEHPVIQKHLRELLGLPANFRVKPQYVSTADFKPLVDSAVEFTAAMEVRCLNRFKESFMGMGDNAERGDQAARAAVIPGLALFCSLVGAVAHLCKLLMLSLRLAVAGRKGWLQRIPGPFSLGIFGFIFVGLLVSDNSVTLSKPHAQIEQAARQESRGVLFFFTPVILSAAHVVEVGQAYAYPVNDFMRRNLLLGTEFNFSQTQTKPNSNSAKQGREQSECKLKM